MTITNTVTEEKIKVAIPQLNMADLKTVKWVGDTHYFQQAYNSSISKYNHYRNWPIVRWIFAVIELAVLSVAMFIQQLPWPEKFVSLVYKVDSMMESGLNFTYNKLDWVSDFFKNNVILWFYSCLRWVERFLEKKKTQ